MRASLTFLDGHSLSTLNISRLKVLKPSLQFDIPLWRVSKVPRLVTRVLHLSEQGHRLHTRSALGAQELVSSLLKHV